MLGESTIYLHHTCNTGVVSQTYVLLTKLFQAKMLPINKQTVTTCSETQELIYIKQKKKPKNSFTGLLLKL